jgi:hypothetical protein
MAVSKSKVIAAKPISHCDTKGQLDLKPGDVVPLSRFKDSDLEALFASESIVETGEDPLTD